MRRRGGAWSSLRWWVIPSALMVAVLSWVTRWSLWMVVPLGAAAGLVMVFAAVAALGWIMKGSASKNRLASEESGT